MYAETGEISKGSKRLVVTPASPTTNNIYTEKNISFIDAEKRVTMLQFPLKEPALNYINNSKEKDLIVVGEDKNTNGTKKFYVCKRDYIYYALQKNSFCIYENIEGEQQVKLYVDLDLKEEYLKNDRTVELNNYIDRIYVLVSNVLNKKYDIDNPKCIVLKSRNDIGKVSAHMIFPEIVFKNIYCIKYMFSEIDDSSLIQTKILDPSVYRTGLFRFIWAKKIGKENTLDFYRGINYDLPKSNKQLFDDCSICFINKKCDILTHDFIEKIEKEKIGKVKITNKNFISFSNGEPVWINLYSVKELKSLLDIINIKRSMDYLPWISIGISLFNCNNSLECLNLWDNWSKKCPEKYDINSCRIKWNSFVGNKLKFGLSYLKRCAKTDNPDKFAKLKSFNKICSQMFTTEEINKQFLINLENKNDDVMKMLNIWFKSNTQKIISFISAYGTGKTVLVRYVIDTYKPKKILWITHRQSLTFDLYGSLKNLRFANYLDGDYSEPRLICQIESLHRIINSCDDELVYDLIVLDESESLLNHYSSSTIKDPRYTFNIMYGLVNKAKKIIALDGDFSDRSYLYLKSIDNNLQIIENMYKTQSKNYLFTNDVNKFDKLIDDDIKENKNICIVSMSANVATNYYEKYKNNKIIMHCSTSDDSLKRELRNVNEFWSKYQIIIYSPTVGEGVDFNVNHIDKMYVILSDKSTSPRGLLQMCGRVRKLKDVNINVYLNGFPYNEHACLYNIDDVNDYYDELHKRYAIKKLSLYDEINNYNELENLNKNKALFISCLIELLKKKGHTYKFDDTLFKKQKNNNIYTQNAIINAPDIDDDEYSMLLIKQKNNFANHDEKLSIIKQCYKIYWKTNTIDEKFMKYAYRKTHILFNLKSLINKFKGNDIYRNNYSEFQNIVLADEMSEYLDIEKAKTSEKINIITDLINGLGFNDLNDNKLIKKDDFEKNKNENIKKNILFTNQEYSLPLFNMKKRKILTNKAFLGFINTIFSNYGIKIAIKRKAYTLNNNKDKNVFFSLQINDGYGIFVSNNNI